MTDRSPEIHPFNFAWCDEHALLFARDSGCHKCQKHDAKLDALRSEIVRLTQEREQIVADRNHSVRRHAELETQLAQVQQELAEAKEWKDCVIDALVCDYILTAENQEDPRRAINDLLCWQQKIALDPAVSKDAHDLVERAEKAEVQLTQLRAGIAAVEQEMRAYAAQFQYPKAATPSRMRAWADQLAALGTPQE